jgi:hypothetical protein
MVTTDPYEDKYKLAALKCPRGSFPDTFMRVPLRVNVEGYEISPLLFGMLHTKKIAGDDNMEDHTLDFFEDIVELFKLNAFTHEEMKLKIVSQTLSNTTLIWYKALST